MTTIAAFCPLSLQTLFDRNGTPIVGGRVYFYDAGTTTPRTVYSDPDLTLAHTTPVLTDAYGRIPRVYVGLGSYKVVLRDDVNALIDQVDALPGGSETAPTPATPTSGWNTADLKIAFSADVQDGWLLCNGKTIGNASSGATARANADVATLFASLWNTDATLAVSGGRGVSATVDFAAAKTIALPSGRGLTFVGADGMGNSLAGVLTSATTATPNAIGTRIGVETISLSTSNVPATLTTTIAGHTLTTSEIPGHNHAGSDSGHAHGTTESPHAHYLPDLFSGAHATANADSGLINYSYTSIGSNGTSSASTGLTVNVASANLTIDFTGGGLAHTHGATTVLSGTGSAHSNIQPGMIVYFLIKI